MSRTALIGTIALMADALRSIATIIGCPLPLWLLCTLFLSWFLLHQLPEVYQDLSFGFVVVAVVLLWWAP